MRSRVARFLSGSFTSGSRAEGWGLGWCKRVTKWSAVSPIATTSNRRQPFRPSLVLAGSNGLTNRPQGVMTARTTTSDSSMSLIAPTASSWKQ